MNARWVDPLEEEGQRELVAKVLTGSNYRLSFENVTRRKLLTAYAKLAQIARQHPTDDERWRAAIRILLADPSQRDLTVWLLGLTRKTAENLGIKVADYPSAFDQLMAELEEWPDDNPRETALLLWCGAATLTIRGSQKARIGKALERTLARAALTVLGLTEGTDFWLDIPGDAEVARQTDAEVATQRGRVRMEVGLIGRGNPEVIGDKIERMDRNGVVLFDVLSPTSGMWNTAGQRGVKLIQLRNGNPVEELRQHLAGLGVAVHNKPMNADEVEQAVQALGLNHFKR